MRSSLVLLACAPALASCLPDLDGYAIDTLTDGGPGVRPRCADPVVVGAGYAEGFEAGPAGWEARGAESSWALGRPETERLPAAAAGERAWVTNPRGDHANGELSSLTSPCFDARGSAEDLLLRFALFHDTERCCDEGWLELSVEGGDWTRVEGDADALGWYAAEAEGWAGDSEGWIDAQVVLPGTAGRGEVQLRFVFSSDASVTDEGLAVDAVRLAPARTDLAVELLPGERCGDRIARVRNEGARTVAGFRLTSVVDGVEETRVVEEPLPPLAEARLPVGSGSSTDVAVRVHVEGDAVEANDAASWRYPGGLPVASAGWDFEADDGGWQAGGENATWAWGEPGGAFIGAAASGARAWVTNPAGVYANGEESWLASPCLDVRAATRDPQLRFAHIYETESCCDEGWVEVVVGAGEWRKLEGAGTNWYDDVARGEWQGTSGSPGVWREAAHPLDGAAGEERVRFRFRFSSDGSQQRDGFGVDDVRFAF
ncbi:MAG TPA: hypothetical protein RMH85_29565 [Polyangiaceae bacterium LLY-WYZ-15_(1-7)]|nr:hypothetical protein [Polyangiaceae bacterium LLY-WYZ-15_(1-7)]HJL02661.1 hypothetical protein [Polyangiaceae bacterium LLY-WYZ-15_(1-7)]HJL12666.1 hypothetical protein [Polyangiaceae bacterium LLY-WYZ-15_(1-7)]HJL23212.1 hypothetical protein [Polyangiaceae bacterium LLY-WYZ-15_(1-7)]